jgi:hypothetical protein
MIPLWKGKNPIYFGVITIIPFNNLFCDAHISCLHCIGSVFALSALDHGFKPCSGQTKDWNWYVLLHC